jgi:hypothetical protein
MESSLKVPAFDMLVGQFEPYMGFGKPILDSQALIQSFELVVSNARSRIDGIFNCNVDEPENLPDFLDKVISKMWDDGWVPVGNDVNLFATDFGAITSDAVLRTLGGIATFRSETDLSHASIWWSDCMVEVFPFHHALKSLLYKDGNSMKSFYQGIAHRVTCALQM